MWVFLYPNIYGGVGEGIDYGGSIPNGAFGTHRGNKEYSWASGRAYVTYPYLNALLVSTIYKNDCFTVQPESYRVHYIIKY